MKLVKNISTVFISVSFVAIALCSQFCTATRKQSFSVDVKPILNAKCISCHGGVKQQAGFSILFREDMFKPTKSGKLAVVPGHPEQSEMIRRLTLTDPEERMPYQHDPLSPNEIEILSKWIKEGALWGDHWAYLPVQQVQPENLKSNWVKNDVDKFILKKLQEQKINPANRADKSTLLRRVSLDLIGMYPSESTIQNFLEGKDNNAYEKLVDTLLASPHFGERWATPWLDIARYADSKGYEKDRGRLIWPYRDWVIQALNADMPYDQFLTEQIAGDLLPNPSDAQYIATAFHRNTMSNDEGGTENEEFRTAAVLDRVSTTWEGIMSTSFACVQCHSHPYDPFRHNEFYKFLAYFNNTRDEDLNTEYPLFKLFDEKSKQDLADVVKWVQKNGSNEEATYYDKLLKTGQPILHSTNLDSIKNGYLADNNISLSIKNYCNARLKNVHFDKYDYVMVRMNTQKDHGKIAFHLDSPNGEIFAKSDINASKTWQLIHFNFTKPISGVHTIYFSYKNDSTADEKGVYGNLGQLDWLYFGKQFPGGNQEGFQALNTKFLDLVNSNSSTIPIMVENPVWLSRKTNIFIRGAWTDKGEEVTPGVPKVFESAMPPQAPSNRLGLAMWLTSTKNPLVSRTIVNRIWEQIFGNGIVETLEDMGSQGVSPTHQELLDYLAWKLMHENNWSLKKLVKEIVMSATYCQDSKLTEEIKQKDLYNKLYARGPRVRLSGEQIRDQHLSISGALNPNMFGQPVMPSQPDDFWLAPYDNQKWTNDTGINNYRRAVYTYLKRSSIYPSLVSFDGSTRVICTSKRIITNTPLQALVTLNDEMYFEIANQFASRMYKAGGTNIENQITKGYYFMTFKTISSEKLRVFTQLYYNELNAINSHKQKIEEIVINKKLPQTSEFASLVLVANAMLNVDEVITKN